jgi:hypothetical protein
VKGKWTLADIGHGISGLSIGLFTRALGWSAEQLEVFLIDIRKNFHNKKIQGYFSL